MEIYLAAACVGVRINGKKVGWLSHPPNKVEGKERHTINTQMELRKAPFKFYMMPPRQMPRVMRKCLAKGPLVIGLMFLHLQKSIMKILSI